MALYGHANPLTSPGQVYYSLTSSRMPRASCVRMILPHVIVVRTCTSGFLHVVVGGISIRSLENPRDGGVVKHLFETAT